MTLSLDIVALGAPDVRTAHDFYTAVLAPVVADHGQYVELDMHGTGRVGLVGATSLATDAGTEPAAAGFRGYVTSFILDQPSEVEAVLAAAVAAGARVLKPAKKSMFAGFSAVFEAPDGAIWKLASANKKDKAPAASPPIPSETVMLIGVADTKASKTFYEALGMTVDRDYGSKFVDFVVAPDACRFGLMPRPELAKDAGVDDATPGFGDMVLNCRVETPDDVDALIAAAESAGGRVAVAAGEAAWGGYTGHFADPDGFLWKVGSA